jgi:hypothetical protein
MLGGTYSAIYDYYTKEITYYRPFWWLAMAKKAQINKKKCI